MMTREQLARARAKEVADKKTFRRMIIAVLIILLVVGLFAIADTLYVPRVRTVAIVTGLRESWTLKRGERCVTTLDTSLGPTAIWTKGQCTEVTWSIGQKVAVWAKTFRLTQVIAVETRRTAFAGAHSLPMF